MARPTAIRLIQGAILLLGGTLAGCGEPYTLQPLFRTTDNPQFVTVATVALRSGEEDEDSVVAIVPKGTLVRPVDEVAKEAVMQMKVEAPQGTGWVYNRFIALREPPETFE